MKVQQVWCYYYTRAAFRVANSYGRRTWFGLCWKF